MGNQWAIGLKKMKKQKKRVKLLTLYKPMDPSPFNSGPPGFHWFVVHVNRNVPEHLRLYLSLTRYPSMLKKVYISTINSFKKPGTHVFFLLCSGFDLICLRCQFIMYPLSPHIEPSSSYGPAGYIPGYSKKVERALEAMPNSRLMNEMQRKVQRRRRRARQTKPTKTGRASKNAKINKASKKTEIVEYK